MGQTNNYRLRKPTDPNAPADLITIVGALADDVDSALTGAVAGKVGSAGYADSAGYAGGAGNADTVDGHHAHDFAGAGHGHNPSGSGIGVIHHNFGSLSAGQTKSQRFGRSNDQYPVVSVNHPSTYILAVISGLDNGGFTVEVRNSTSSTNHTNVHVIVHLVRAA